MKSESQPREEAAHALKQASRAAKAGDAAGAERWAKIAERMASAASRLGASTEPEDDAATVETVRAELRRRMTRFIEAAHARDLWTAQSEMHARLCALAREHKFAPPPPLPPCPYSDDDLEAIGAGWDTSARPSGL